MVSAALAFVANSWAVDPFTVRDIRQALYAKFVQLPIPFFEKNRVALL